jgi:ferric-dicitrate binding protein FerR (iron transport regulator)
MASAEHRFAELLSLVLDGACSDAEREEFARLQRENPRLVVGHLDTIFTHSLLQWQSEDISDCMTLELAAKARDDVAEPTAAHSARYSRRTFWAAGAAVLLVAAGFAAWQVVRAAAVDQPIAEVVAQSGVTWATDSTALVNDNLVVPGRLQNKAGSFTLQFRSGPTVRIAGPTSLEIKSAMLVYLDRGQATARVPESSKGFAIKTPVAKVVDQGTEFGVAARDDGKTDVIVFEGRVDVQEMAGPLLQPRSLIIGDAARIDALGSIDRIMEIGRDTSGQWWTKDPGTDKYLIASVNDNIVSDVSDMFTCYQTTYGGLQDDALAYADNPYHQWNGLTAEGLPAFLRGADYIKTFNDYRYRQDFELTIVISKPTNLYVFADNRIPPPDWLKNQFEDTGVDIGLDEGPWLRQAEEKYRKLDKNTTAVGAGKSIDNTFSVWRRRCVNPGPVTLGNAGKWATEGKRGRAMYGIAATPMDAPQPASDAAPRGSGI